MGEYADVDKWIETLRQCKPLSEANVKGLCDKVGLPNRPNGSAPSLFASNLFPIGDTRREKFCKMSRMCSLCAAP